MKSPSGAREHHHTHAPVIMKSSKISWQYRDRRRRDYTGAWRIPRINTEENHSPSSFRYERTKSVASSGATLFSIVIPETSAVQCREARDRTSATARKETYHLRVACRLCSTLARLLRAMPSYHTRSRIHRVSRMFDSVTQVTGSDDDGSASNEKDAMFKMS